MSESLENDRWSSGSVDYSSSINWDCSKRLTIINFTLSRSAFEALSSTIFEACFPPSGLTVGTQFIVILTKKKTLLFKFLWLEFRFKSFLEMQVHFKGLMCIRMRRLPDSSWWVRLMPNCVFIEWSKICSKILNDINIITIFGGDRLELWPNIHSIHIFPLHCTVGFLSYKET